MARARLIRQLLQSKPAGSGLGGSLSLTQQLVVWHQSTFLGRSACCFVSGDVEIGKKVIPLWFEGPALGLSVLSSVGKYPVGESRL